MTTTLNEYEQKAEATTWHADWLVSFGRRPRNPETLDPLWSWASLDTTLTVRYASGSDLRVAQDSQHVVLISGLVTNIDEIDPSARQKDAARIALDLVKSRGREAFNSLRGPFAVLAWDRNAGTLMVARDHVGLQPIFYARRADGRWLLSASAEVLASQPGVSSEADPVVLSEWLCGWFPHVEDTAYRSVRRVPPATVLTFGGPEVTRHRYWDLLTERKDVQWLEESDLDAFEPLLERAVRRTVNGFSPAIFLSGGVDSISVALSAVDGARQTGTAPPLALSLAFPDKVSNEETIQKGVASQLGLEQVMVPFADAAGARGLLAEALAMSVGWPQPMWNIWSPAYDALAREAAMRDRNVILTGRGGDEWFTITPYIMADQLRRGDLAGAWRFLQMRRRSNQMAGLRAPAQLMWLAAGRPLASAACDALAPAAWHRRRRRRLLTERPDWIAPASHVRRAMDERLDAWIDAARPAGGFYQRESLTAIRHPAVTHAMEETQEFGRRHGMRVLHPFWDPDLIEMLHRVPPDLLMRDGRSKWLLRRKLSHRLPGLGLERRGKVHAGHVFTDVMTSESSAVWDRMGGARALAKLGVVTDIDLGKQQDLSSLVGSPGRLWTLLNLETWVRHRS